MADAGFLRFDSNARGWRHISTGLGDAECYNGSRDSRGVVKTGGAG